MKQDVKMPKVQKINWVKELAISVVFNNGESRIIDFRKLFGDIGIDRNSPAFILFNLTEFEKVELIGNTLSWPNVEQYITMRNREMQKVPYEIGADILLKYSHPEKTDLMVKIGRLVRDARKKAGITQQELALISGTSRSHISKIENDRLDVEIETLSKIIEIGLGRRLEINIK